MLVHRYYYMMPKNFDYSLFVPNNELAMGFFRSIRWADGIRCPFCNSNDIHNRGNRNNNRRYTCKDCGINFNDFTNTVFHKSKVPMGAMLYILMNLRNKSIKQLSEELEYSRVTIARIADKFRTSILKNNENPNISGEIEFDEMYISSGDKGVKKTFREKEALKDEEEGLIQ